MFWPECWVGGTKDSESRRDGRCLRREKKEVVRFAQDDRSFCLYDMTNPTSPKGEMGTRKTRRFMATAAHNPAIDDKREFLRHTLATLAYRGGKALRDGPSDFPTFRVAEGSRTPGEILAHLGDLLDWALSMSEGKQRWQDSPPIAWEDGVRRFHAGLKALDDYLASGAPLAVSAESLFQGPIA